MIVSFRWFNAITLVAITQHCIAGLSSYSYTNLAAADRCMIILDDRIASQWTQTVCRSWRPCTWWQQNVPIRLLDHLHELDLKVTQKMNKLRNLNETSTWLVHTLTTVVFTCYYFRLFGNICFLFVDQRVVQLYDFRRRAVNHYAFAGKVVCGLDHW